MYPIRITFSSAPRRDGSDPNLRAVMVLGMCSRDLLFQDLPIRVVEGGDKMVIRDVFQFRLGPRDENMQQRNISSEMAVSDLMRTLESDGGPCLLG